MLENPRRKNSLKKKLTAYILLLIILGFAVFSVNLFLQSKNSSYISPLGKNSIDRNKVEKILRDNHILFSQVLLVDSSYTVIIPNNGQVRLSMKKDISQQIASLQRILRELTIEGKSFKSIDFRFEEPTVSF